MCTGIIMRELDNTGIKMRVTQHSNHCTRQEANLVAIFSEPLGQPVSSVLGVAEEHGTAHRDGEDIADGLILLLRTPALHIHLENTKPYIS